MEIKRWSLKEKLGLETNNFGVEYCFLDLGGCSAPVYDLRDFPYLHTRSGVSPREHENCGERLHKVVSGGRRFYIMGEEERKRASMDQAHGCLGTGPPARPKPKGTRPGRMDRFLPLFTAGFLR